MPRFAANLSMLFNEVPFLERFALAARSGFRAVEVQFPYAWPAEAIRHELDVHGLQMVLHNLPAGDWALGERGIACLPDRVEEFRAGVAQAIHYARILGVPRLNCLAGLRPPELSAELALHTFVENLRFAAAALAKAELQLLIEPINTFDVPGFYLNRFSQALPILSAVGAGNLAVQYDLYHAQRMEGELAATLEKHLDRIGHIQIADNPGRHEPGSGEIHYPFLFRHLERLGYSGWVGCEYLPAHGTEAGLGWLKGEISA